MNNLTFSEGITYKYKYTTGSDFIPADVKPTNIYGLYAYSQNNAIDIKFDTSNVTDMRYMFNQCSNVTVITQFDTSNVTYMDSMFSSCSNLTSAPEIDTSNVITMSNMFQGCNTLTSIPQLDCSKVTDIGIFGYGGCKTLVNLGGFKNLGMQKSISNTSNGNYFLGASSQLTYESIMNVINNLYDRKTAGYSVLTLKLHADTLALLSDEEKAIATNKGWTLS